jgi:hypothetical protein
MLIGRVVFAIVPLRAVASIRLERDRYCFDALMLTSLTCREIESEGVGGRVVAPISLVFADWHMV